jgi:putative FmdB family regulatory protein
MPLYEYQCDVCSHRFEVIQKFSDPLVDTCPKCGAAVRKLMSSPAIQFKGSGFYITDYPKPGSGSGKEEGGSKPKDSASAPATGSESGSKSGAESSSDQGSKSEKTHGSKSEKTSTSETSPSAPAATAPKKD